MADHGEARKLEHMANQIAGFFRPYPVEEARDGVLRHLKRFWTPKMRAELLEHADNLQLDPLVRDALPKLG